MKRVPWLALAAFLAGLGTWAAGWLGPWAERLPGCTFKGLTGFACATCGLTRCVVALGRWDWGAAFHWHPVVAGLALLLPLVALWDLRRAWRGAAYPELPESRAARIGAWAFLLGTWAIQVFRGI